MAARSHSDDDTIFSRTRRVEIWRQWITPHSTDRQEAFRERTIRGLIVFIVLALFVFYVSPLFNREEFNAIISPYADFGLMLVVLAAAAAAITRQKVGLAGLFVMLAVSLTLLISLKAGYWNRSAQPLILILIILATVCLPTPYLIWFSASLVVLIWAVGVCQEASGLRPPPALSPGIVVTPGTNATSVAVYGAVVLALFFYLKREFDRRVDEVNDLVNTLEKRVAERTHDLQVVADVSRQITTVLELAKLLPQLVERTLKEFNLYHVSVFLLDEARQSLRRAAGAGTGSLHTATGNGEFKIADHLAIPFAAFTREPVRLNNVQQSELYLPDTSLPDTRSELVLPMVVGEQLVGVLDMRSDQVERFTPDNVRTLTNLTEQIGIAVTNARLFAEVEQARRESEILYRVSRSVNATTSYPHVVKALISEIGIVDYNIALSIFQNYNIQDATYTDVVALVWAGTTQVVELNQRFPLNIIDGESMGVVVVEDMDYDPRINNEQAAFYKGLGIHTLLSASVALGQRRIGSVTFFSEKPRTFTAFERRIVRGVADLAATVIERSRLLAEAEAAREAAESANRVKSQFLANMSHELRTPLNAILNFTAFVADGVFGPVNGEQVEALQQSISSGKHLLSLINDILDLSKIEAGLMDLFIQEIDFNEVLAALVSLAKGLIKDKPLELVTDIEANLPHTFGDRRRIRQILLNLVSNAVKFTPTGSITIAAHLEDQAVHVTVSDTGIGISPEDQAMIFESFKQARHDLPETVGTGLGLPITRFFVEAHGGRLWLDSEIGKGTTFHCILPVRSAEEANTANLPLIAQRQTR